MRRPRRMTRTKLLNELSSAANWPTEGPLIPLSMANTASELKDLLLCGQVSAQQAADQWVEEQRRWTKREMLVGRASVPLPRRRSRDIQIISERVT